MCRKTECDVGFPNDHCRVKISNRLKEYRRVVCANNVRKELDYRGFLWRKPTLKGLGISDEGLIIR